MSGAPLAAAAVSQALPSLLTLGFATLSLAVARHTPPPLAAEGHRAAWRLTGAAFLVAGAHALATTVAGWAGAALPAGDAGRAPVLLLYAAALLLLVWRGDARLRRGGVVVWAALTLALLPGVAAPWWLPWLALSPAVAAGTAEAATVVLLLAALLVALLRDAVDQLLWGALALFALRAAVGAWLPLLPWTARPSSAATALTAVALAAMVALAARRLALARRGARVPSLMEPLWPHRMRPAR